MILLIHLWIQVHFNIFSEFLTEPGGNASELQSPESLYTVEYTENTSKCPNLTFSMMEVWWVAVVGVTEVLLVVWAQASSVRVISLKKNIFSSNSSQIWTIATNRATIEGNDGMTYAFMVTSSLWDQSFIKDLSSSPHHTWWRWTDENEKTFLDGNKHFLKTLKHSNLFSQTISQVCQRAPGSQFAPFAHVAHMRYLHQAFKSVHGDRLICHNSFEMVYCVCLSSSIRYSIRQWCIQKDVTHAHHH